jgi:hypothetical protein
LDFQIQLTVDLARNSRIGGNAVVGSGHTVFFTCVPRSSGITHHSSFRRVVGVIGGAVSAIYTCVRKTCPRKTYPPAARSRLGLFVFRNKIKSVVLPARFDEKLISN